MNGDALSSSATKSIEHEDCLVEDLKIENLKFSENQFEDDFIAPSDELRNKILKQVEYLFSDSNLPKDKFLLKHICRNKEGYVSLKLISSLRKVKALTKDWRVVAYSLEKSEKLQMNNEKTKIRRLEPLPDSAEETNMKKVIVIKKSSDTISTEEVKTFLMNTSSFTFAIAEFLNAEEASLAIYHVPHSEDAFIIVPYVNDDSKEGSKIISPNNSPKEGKIKIEHRRVYLDHDDYKTANETTKISSPSLQNYFNNKTSPRIKKSPKEIKNSEDSQLTLSCSYKGDGITTAWKPRRQMSVTHEKKSVIIIREPRGPDGTIGFHAGRAKANLKTHKIL
ncbi:la-related protein 6 [Trichonephila clavata]|uniref:La-related protein 6 n=1 Tax=Trichonephila clavata TaxID=2740835 RepID=A0A8X6LEI2_TRICU|nr:la-related protein 6 [Trichonephila clavata]